MIGLKRGQIDKAAKHNIVNVNFTEARVLQMARALNSSKGLTSEEITVGRRLNNKGYTARMIGEALGWSVREETIVARFKKVGIRVLCGKRRVHDGGEILGKCDIEKNIDFSYYKPGLTKEVTKAWSGAAFGPRHRGRAP